MQVMFITIKTKYDRKDKDDTEVAKSNTINTLFTQNIKITSKPTKIKVNYEINKTR